MNNDLIHVNTLPPFKRMCMTIGELPTSYLETMTYYEMLVWLCNYLEKTVIPTINNNSEAVEELQEKYIELKTYVDNYFDNLDVQEEINNKLDAMAESGELTDIIAQYLGLAGMITFDTVSDMKLAENLVNGSKVSTLGFYQINDGGNALYKVRTITNEDIIDEKSIIALSDNTLIAELVYDTANVKQFGAYGDGVHDDTLAIQTAINKIKSNLYIPSGTYKITPTNQYLIDGYGTNIRPYYGLYINNKSNINIKCDGILVPDYTNNNMNILAIQNSNNIDINGLKSIYSDNYVDHGSILQTRSLLNINKCNNIHVTNCYVENSGSCCIVVASTNSTIENSKAVRTSLDYITASYFGLYTCENCLLNNNICYGASNDGDMAMFGICKKCVASNNKLYSYLENDNTVNMTGSQGLGVDSACSECIVNKNYLDKYFYGIDVKTSSRNNIITDNIVMNCKYGIASRLGEGNQITSDLTISNNYIMPNDGNGNTDVIKDTTSVSVGIFVSNTLGCNITNNAIIPQLQNDTTTHAHNYIGILVCDIPSVDESAIKLFKIDGNQILQRNALGNSKSYNSGRAIYIMGTSSKNAVHVSIINNSIKPPFGNVSEYQLHITYGKYVIISNNSFSSGYAASGNNGQIYCDNSTLINIDSNMLDSARHTLVMNTCSDVSYVNNTFNASGGNIDCVQLTSVNRAFITGNYYIGKATNEGIIFNIANCNYINFTNNTAHTNKSVIFYDSSGASTNITNTGNVLWSIS